jgi:predicted aspartyl protease
MKTLIRGKIEDLVPFFNGYVDDSGTLIIQGDGNLALTVDTGFSGGIALPEEILEEMDIELIDYGTFELATGDEIELPVYWGKVMVKDDEIETWFVPGELLLGMEFLSSLGSRLSFDFGKEEVRLLK